MLGAEKGKGSDKEGGPEGGKCAETAENLTFTGRNVGTSKELTSRSSTSKLQVGTALAKTPLKC